MLILRKNIIPLLINLSLSNSLKFLVSNFVCVEFLFLECSANKFQTYFLRPLNV